MSQVVQQRPDELISILQPEFYGKASPIAGPAAGRLTLTSGVPLTYSDQLAAATLYYTPYNGDVTWVRLSDGYWVPRKFSELSIAVPATKYRFFDIFVYDNAGTLALETQDWNQTSFAISGATNAAPIVVTAVGHTFAIGNVVAITDVTGNTAANGVWYVSAVAGNTFTIHGSTGSGAYAGGGTAFRMTGLSRAVAVSMVDGRWVQTLNPTRLMLGTGCTTAVSGQTESSYSKRFLYNLYNKELTGLRYYDSTGHNYNSTTLRYWNNNPNAKVMAISPFQTYVPSDVCHIAGSFSSVTNAICVLYIGFNNSSGASTAVIGSTVATNMGFGMSRLSNPTSEFLFYAVVEMGHAGNPLFSTVDLNINGMR